MWLETHVWHAKRMHMKKIWGYSLVCLSYNNRNAEREEAIRLCLRQRKLTVLLTELRSRTRSCTMHHTILWLRLKVQKYFWLRCWKCPVIHKDQDRDQSSMSTYWPVPWLLNIRYRCLDGHRVLETHLYKLDSYPFDLIGPIAIIWQPLPQSSMEKSASSNVRSSTSKKKTIDKELPDVVPGPMTIRTIWLRFHPSVQLEVFDTLKQAASRTLVKSKIDSNDFQEATLKIADLTSHVNVFEIMGPKSSQVIKGALSPVSSENRKDFLKVSSNITT